jgi:hypothetical protein
VDTDAIDSSYPMMDLSRTGNCLRMDDGEMSHLVNDKALRAIDVSHYGRVVDSPECNVYNIQLIAPIISIITTIQFSQHFFNTFAFLQANIRLSALSTSHNN